MGKGQTLGLLGAMLAGLYFTITFVTQSPEDGGILSSRKEAPVPTTIESASDSYWSTVYITEEEFYQYLEDQLMSDGYYDYLYHQVYQ